MEIRQYHWGEEHEIWQLFTQTIHHINAKHYTESQLSAWAPKKFDQALWTTKLAMLGTFVCIEGRKIVGYSDLQPSGYIDHFFCHHLYQGYGVGTALMEYIHGLAEQCKIVELSAEVSITARPFFKTKGFKLVKPQTVLLRGQTLANFKMHKRLRS